jgi:glycosyltransferase involved in cell wall biosynthesis
MVGMLAASLDGRWDLSHRRPKWTKYAGNWVQRGRMPLSFSFQRAWLRGGAFGGPVTVNGKWPRQPKHVYTFDNPSLTLRQVGAARRAVRSKRLQTPIRLVYVGRIVAEKGLGVALQVVRRLLDGNGEVPSFELVFDVVGDGPDRHALEEECQRLDLEQAVCFYGWLPHSRVCEVLRDAHVMLLPSHAPEGWPKVLSEAMAYGVVPISSRVSAIPQVLAEVGSGAALEPEDVDGYVRAVRRIAGRTDVWQQMVEAGLRAAPRFTYERYLMRLDAMLSEVYGYPCFERSVMAELETQWKAAREPHL